MNYSESDTKAKYIDPSLKSSGWEEVCIKREFFFTDGRKTLGGKRGKRKFADYLLVYGGIKLAIIEAKKQDLDPTHGLQQALEYASILNVRFVYASNGLQIYEFDLLTGTGQFISSYPAPKTLYDAVIGNFNPSQILLLTQPYYLSDKKPRYYQENAIQKTLEALAKDQQRILLTLATGTGKTVIAFQIVYKLFNARWSKDGIGTRRPRVLFLADRNILLNQAMNTFNPLEHDLIRIDGAEIRKRHGKVPTNAHIFFSIYQALTGGSQDDENQDHENARERLQSFPTTDRIDRQYFQKYPRDFFDLIIIDECHRGGAREDGNWAEILKYFDSAVHLGLTATPKRKDNIDTYKYFGTPVYEYSLKTGIDDGFLTPFKIKRIKLNIDELVLNSGDTVVSGEITKDVYYTKDMEREIIIQERSDLIAQTILQQINKMDKTIIFCVDQSHALRIRDSINAYKELKDPDYCVRVTSDEGDLGRAYLERFQDNDKDLPVILTSSQMLTTGVDALNVRNIVLVRYIGSIVEYKQIIGRGTRLFDGKDFFTIYDFVGATNDFIDELWDGLPEEDGSIEPAGTPQTDSETSQEETQTGEGETVGEGRKEKKEKLVVQLGSKREVKVIDIETRYLDPSTGKHLNSEDFLKRIIPDLPSLYRDEHQLRMLWSAPETREELLHNLANIGLDTEQLEDLGQMFEALNSDIFDILAHISFHSEIQYRTQRSQYGKETVLKYTNIKAREFLEFLLGLYIKNGILEFRKDGLASKIALFNKGQPRELAESFGGMQELKDAYYELQKSLYAR